MAAPQAGFRAKPPHSPHRNLPWDILFLRSGPIRCRRTCTASGRIRRGNTTAFLENAHLLSALDVEEEDVLKTAFGPNMPRLAAIKKKYDPTNFFRVNHNIKPSDTAGGHERSQKCSLVASCLDRSRFLGIVGNRK